MESQERAGCFNDQPNVSVLEKSHPETMPAATTRASRYLCVWFPNWPIQRLVVAQPELRRQPVVLFYRDPRRGQLVSACSPRASQAGIASQMPLAEAKSLAARDRRRATGHSKTEESFGEQYAWHWQEHHPEHDLQRLEHLADRCQWFSPVVGLEHADQPSCLLLDVTGVARLFGGEATLARQMLRWLSHRGYWPKIAIADTLGVAWGMAHFGQPRWLEADDLEGEDSEGEESHAAGAPPSPAPADKGLPHAALPHAALPHAALPHAASPTSRQPSTHQALRVAWSGAEIGGGQEQSGDAWLEAVQREVEPTCDAEGQSLEGRQENSGRVKMRLLEPCLVPAADRTWFEQLPIAALRLPEETCEVLRQLGVEQIHQLGSLPRDGLATRLGSELVQRWDQAWGWSKEVLVSFRRPPELVVKIDLEVPATRRDAVWEWVQQAIQRMTRQLWERQLGVLRLDMILQGVDQPPVRLRLDLFRPVAEAEHLLSLLQLQIEQHALPAALQGVEAQVVLAAPLEQHQIELFDSCATDQRSVSDLINRLSSRLGAEQVVDVKLRYGAQPEFAFQTQPVAGRKKARRKRGTRKGNTARGGKRSAGRNGAETMEKETEGRAPRSADRQPMFRPLRLFPRPIPLETEGCWSEAREHSVKQSQLQRQSQLQKQSAFQRQSELQRQSAADAREGALPASTPRASRYQQHAEATLARDFSPPARFRLQGQQQRVCRSWGPERVETGWWRGPMVQRDYYRIETESGQRFWIFRDRAEGRWFLHGDF